VRIRLDIAYDGTAFHGWAAQPGLRTVQGVLETWLIRVLRQDVELTVAGRTDAGVHARGQVAHFNLAEPPADAASSPVIPTSPGTSAGPGTSPVVPDSFRVQTPPVVPDSFRDQTPPVIPDSFRDLGTQSHAPRRGALAGPRTAPEDQLDRLARNLNRVLPEDVVVKRVSPAPAGFDARFAAIWRRYVYRLCDSVPDPLGNVFTARSKYRLDAAAMHDAAQALLGLHDFAAFSKARESATAIRTLQRVVVTRVGPVVELEFQADAFAHSMVRSLVGALVEVGAGRRDAAWLASLLNRGERAGEVTVMPAKGLTLEEVGYPPDAELAARVAAARAKRSL
jgi:tRNA pseudouridine38-40 synthase